LHFKPCILNPNLFECTFNPKAAAAAKYFDDDMPDEYDALDAGRDFDGGVLLVDSRQISTTQPTRGGGGVGAYGGDVGFRVYGLRFRV